MRRRIGALLISAALLAPFTTTACADPDSTVMTASQALSAEERGTCEAECEQNGGEPEGCAVRCAFVEDAFEACYDSCVDAVGPDVDEQCRARCSGEWREAVSDGQGDSCLEGCIERGGTATECRAACAGSGNDIPATDTEDVLTCIEQCLSDGGSPEGCREACS